MATDTNKKKMHYAFLIFIGCCCVCAGSYGSILSTVSVYVVPLVTALGCGVGDLMLFMTFFSIVGFFSTNVCGKLLHTKNFRVVSTVLVLIILVAQLMFAFGTEIGVVWYWIWGAVLGIALPAVGAIITPTLISNWFDKSVSGKYLGIAAACTGIGTFVFAPLFTQLIGSVGLQATYIINVVIAAVLTLPFTMFVFRYKPSEMGLEQYGAKKDAAQADAPKKELTGITKKEATRTATFYILIVMMFCLAIVYGFNSNMVAMCKELSAGFLADPEGYALLGATMVSVAAAANIISKLLFGFVVDKAGSFATFLIFALVHVAAFIIWAFFPTGEALLLIGAFCFGFNGALVNVGMPLLTRSVFGDKEYGPIYSTIASVNALLAGFSATLVGYVYQLFGSYMAANIAGIIIIAILIACLFSIAGKLKKAKN